MEQNYKYQKRNNTKNCIFAGYIWMFYGILQTMKYITILPVMTVNTIGVLLGGASFIYVILKHGINKYVYTFVFLFFYTNFGIVSYLYSGNVDLPELLWPIFFMGIALLLLEEQISNSVAAFPFYFFSFVLIAYILMNGPLYKLDTSESRNYSSVYALSFLSVYILVRDKNKTKEIPWIAVLLGILLSYLSLGRGGVISFTTLGVLFLLYSKKLPKNRILIKKYRIIPILICLSFVSIIMFLYRDIWFNKIILYLEESINFFIFRGMDSSNRSELWKDYLNIVFSSPIHMIVSPKIQGTVLLDQFKDNLHNSFLMLYARYGLIMFIVIISMMIKSIKWHINNKKWIVLIIFITILVRISTDVISFNGVMDIPIYYLLFSPIYNTNTIYKEKKE